MSILVLLARYILGFALALVAFEAGWRASGWGIEAGEIRAYAGFASGVVVMGVVFP